MWDLGGVYGLYAGDLNNDGAINILDRAIAWNARNTTGYLDADSNLDGLINSTERMHTWNNRFKYTQMP